MISGLANFVGAVFKLVQKSIDKKGGRDIEMQDFSQVNVNQSQLQNVGQMDFQNACTTESQNVGQFQYYDESVNHANASIVQPNNGSVSVDLV